MSKRRKGECYTFTVEGSGLFPFDMLRYDYCWPYSEGHDSPKIAAHPCTSDAGLRRVVLQTQNALDPTVGRWESFGWRFIGLGELRNTVLSPTPPRRKE